MDNFGGAEAWVDYCYEMDKKWRYIMENTKCYDCRNFDDETSECRYHGEKVDPNKYASEYDCEEVVPYG